MLQAVTNGTREVCPYARNTRSLTRRMADRSERLREQLSAAGGAL